MAKQDQFNRQWITENAIEVIKEYDKGVLTLRGLHYRLVSLGMSNTIRHYKRVIGAMTAARWEGLVDFDTFSDNDRETIGSTDYETTNVWDSIDEAKVQIKNWLNYFFKNRWENQEYYIEVWIEKKALQGVFNIATRKHKVKLCPCKGYPSLTFLNEAKERFQDVLNYTELKPVIIYFGDYDPSGEDIPRSVQDTLEKMGVYNLILDRIALTEEQVIEMKLPPAPVKQGDSRTANWNGIGQVELDAIEPKLLIKMCEDAIDNYFDYDKYKELTEIEKSERKTYQEVLKKEIENL